MEVEIRLASLADVPILLEYMQELYVHDEIPFDELAARTALTGLLHDESLGRVWVLDVDKRPVGYAVVTFGYSLELRGRDAFLDELYIAPTHQRQGVGAQALRLIEQVLWPLGIRALNLEVERENAGAQQFYTAMGFADRSRFFLMSKRLGPD